MIEALVDYVLDHTLRGECRCGKCVDRGTSPDPSGHTADLIFFPVALKGNPTAKQFRDLTLNARYADVKVFDGTDHSFIQLGGWLGDQGLALRYMGLGTLLGVFELLTPLTVLPGEPKLDHGLVLKMAGQGYVSVIARIRNR